MNAALRITIPVIVLLSLAFAGYEHWRNRDRPTFAALVIQHHWDGARITQLEAENASLREKLKASPIAMHPTTRPHHKTFTLNPMQPVDQQIAEHPDKTPRSPVPGYMWQRMHEKDVATK